ncbi:MAG: hypothetical protein P4N60_13770 [Verrucomicrobiae bacterium]|nr:hypothetical protein [Verrucomicrobiae bacterium]
MKALRRIGWGLLLVLGVLLLVVLCRSLTHTPVHRYDAELSLPRASIPAGSNAFDMLAVAATHLWWPKAQDAQIGHLANNTNWDDALASTVLASNRETLIAWDAAVKLPNLQVPEISTADDLLPYLAEWKKLALLAQVRENVLLRDGHDPEAFDQMVNEIKMGRRMQNAHGVLIDYLVGAAVNNLGLAQMQRWTGQAHLTSDQLKNYARQLELSPDEAGTAYANAIRVEYQMWVATLDAMRQGTLTNSGMNVSYPRAWPAWPLFSFSQTKALYAAGALKLVKASPHPYGEAKIDDLQARPGMVSIFLSGNPIGQILYYMMIPAAASSLEKKSRGDAQLQATRTILALRAYELAHGHLPADLAALVPEFLDKVPLDDYDGKPLRYSADKKIVYSVGPNLKDDGGAGPAFNASTYKKPLDLVFPFYF